ncbi:MAG: hypothetical protein M0C28_18630 [Candidatus Moduliflexus flocculans]|nr:hypothetical protein [Candidatus Moduliflexus flocculans]
MPSAFIVRTDLSVTMKKSASRRVDIEAAGQDEEQRIEHLGEGDVPVEIDLDAVLVEGEQDDRKQRDHEIALDRAGAVGRAVRHAEIGTFCIGESGHGVTSSEALSPEGRNR